MRQITKNAYINDSGEIFTTSLILHKVADGTRFIQSTEKELWLVNHKMNTTRIHAQIFENGTIIFPDSITIVDDATVKIEFAFPQKGECILISNSIE